MSDSVRERLFLLRKEMERRGIDLYLIPSSDFHGSEYVGDYFKAREYITGFTGSAGTAVVAKDEAWLFTDGRYFIQARRQLSGSGIALMRAGEPNVPSVEAFLKQKLRRGGCIGFDGRCVCAKAGMAYEAIAEEKQGRIFSEEDLVGAIWKDRPSMAKEPVFFLEDRFSGRTFAEKVADVRADMERAGANVHILSSLCDIAWLLNVRGGDIDYVPVALSYLVLSLRECIWFVQEEVLTKEQRERLQENQILVRPYAVFYDALQEMRAETVLYDPTAVNYSMVKRIDGHTKKICAKNPSELLKAVKNPVEIENTKRAHIKDGVAFVKFMRWIKTRAEQESPTERQAAAFLLERRKEQAHFLEPSFETICAYGANAAMMHYAATEESDARIRKEGFLLVDSGGHYLEGTTDLTRTLAMGRTDDAMRLHYTAVLRANLRLSAAKFLHGVDGRNLDILAREPLWSLGLDYRCGTGHGVGHVLSVHEGPNAFRYRKNADGSDAAVLEEGMITTDEPGVYLEGEYGIRIENELLCRKAEQNAYGQFLCFETITYAPIDLDAVVPEAMTEAERAQLNAYHQMVYDVLSSHLSEEENRWLKEYTRAI